VANDKTRFDCLDEWFSHVQNVKKIFQQKDAMNKELQKRLADASRQKHQAPPLLLLPNAWDALSAWVFEAAGFEAIATTSGGVAWALGFPDGEKAPWDEVVAVTNRIVRTVGVPVTADIEGGYGAKIPTTLLAVWKKSFAPA
jgi:2-methylisocitrate lyase-like PEP mutase family enzyme